MILILAVLIGYLVWLTWYVVRIKKHYHQFTKNTDKENLTRVLDKIIDQLRLEKEDLQEVRRGLDLFRQDSIRFVQKVGLVRFNPFADTGGDQSFVLAILDGSNSGVILTSLHNRGNTRWYAKNIILGKGVDFDLSDEEKKAIKSVQSVKEH